MKLKILTMAFTRTDIIERGIASLYGAGVPENVEHYMLDQHYPLPSYSHNRDWLINFCASRNIHILDPGHNLGYHEGINWAIEKMSLTDEDILINYDPDAMIQSGSEGWLKAIHKAFTLDTSLSVVGINNSTIDRELKDRGHFDEIREGITLRFMRMPVIMSIIAWQAGFIRQVGGLKEPSKLYGGIEATMFPILCAHGRRWAVLKDYFEDISLNRQADPEYLEWKHCHGYLRTFAGDFDEYLRYIGRIK